MKSIIILLLMIVAFSSFSEIISGASTEEVNGKRVRISFETILLRTSKDGLTAQETLLRETAIKLYQKTFSYFLGPCCRFYPSCSEYALDSFHEHGLMKASWLTFHRLMRCHPWSAGGYDPVQSKKINLNNSNFNSKEKS